MEVSVRDPNCSHLGPAPHLHMVDTQRFEPMWDVSPSHLFHKVTVQVTGCTLVLQVCQEPSEGIINLVLQ